MLRILLAPLVAACLASSALSSELPSPKILFEGKIQAIELASEADGAPSPEGTSEGSKTVGYLTVGSPSGARFRFRIFSYTLLMIRYQGRIWVGRLDQVRVGWPASVAYDLEPDATPAKEQAEPIEKDADNLIVDAPSKDG